MEARARRDRVRAFFTDHSAYWQDIYGHSTDVISHLYQERHTATLEWLDGLALPAGSRALDLGCGVGLLSVDLARREFRVDALDASAAMADRARRNAAEAGVADRIHVATGDAQSLPYPDGTFALVVALGLIPWVDDPQAVLGEMARVTASGGYVIITTANSLRLTHMIDPWHYAPLRPVKTALKDALARQGLRRSSPTMHYHTPWAMERLLRHVGLIPVKRATLGFGPLTLLARSVLPRPLGLAVHRALQDRADRGHALLHVLGMWDRVLAQKQP